MLLNRMDNLLHDLRQRAAHLPVGIVGAELAHVRIVANVIAPPGLLAKAQDWALPGDLVNEFDAFNQAGRVLLAATEVIDFAGRGF